MSNLDLLSAGFSAILGKEVVPQKGKGRGVSVHDLFKQSYIMRPLETVDPRELFDVSVRGLTGKWTKIRVSGTHTVAHVKAFLARNVILRRPHELVLIYGGREMLDIQTLGDYGIQAGAKLHAVLRLRGGGSGPVLPYAFNTDELDPKYDFDFSQVKDDGKRYFRGGFEYSRPYGWKRFAIKVVGRYEDDDWLGPNGIRTEEVPGEWPVSYHGTNVASANLILGTGIKAGPRARFGKGVYTSPSLELVEKLYAQEFTHKGKSYKIVLQNRVNPDQRNGHLQIIPASQTGTGADYWLSPAQDSADVRPYGILIREVTKPNPSPK